MSFSVADRWYETRAVGDGVTQILESHVASWLRCNIWHVAGRERDLIIDTGMGLRPLTEAIARLAERPVTAIVTHSHFDHAGGLHQFTHRCGHSAEADILAAPTPYNTVADTGFLRAETFSALPYEGFDWRSWRLEPAALTGHLDDGDKIDLGDRVFDVFHLPGHSPGSIALLERATGIFFSGDVVYDGDLIDDLYHSDAEVLAHSHARLRELPIRTVHGGHDASFGHARMLQILDEYAAGGRRLGDINTWMDTVSGS
ncbi:MAG: MBL fold metallo-hydrolase [Pseudomonadota bacterium]